MKLKEMKIKELFDTSHTIAERIFDNHTYPWEVLPEIGDFIRSLGPLLPENEYRKIGNDIWVHKSAKVAPTIMTVSYTHLDVYKRQVGLQTFLWSFRK